MLDSDMRFGSYEILGPLGAGGMGEVYRAKDTKLGREVALKILPAAFTNDSERVARFRREAQVLASLNHPHIAQIHGLEEVDGMQFLVLELVDSESLDKRIARGPIPVDEALGIAKQIAEALEAAHEKGIIHRDLKPANIGVTKDGNVKVLDFGLAKAVETTSGAAFDAMNSPTITSPAMMTGVGVILGTAAYMSPEQAKGRPADKRSDMWAFGCVLYEMITGKRAFDAADVADTLAFVLTREPDWTALQSNAPEQVRALIKGCLSRDRSLRIAESSTALFVLRELVRLAPTADAAPVAVSRSSVSRYVIPVLLPAILVIVGLTSLVWWSVRPIPQPSDVMRFSIVLPEDQQISYGTRQVLAISPDGTRIVVVINNALFLRSLSELDFRPIPGSNLGQGISSPAFSPDGRWIAFYAPDRTVKRLAVTGGAPVTMCPVDAPFGLTWDVTGVILGQGSKGIVRCAPNSSQPEQLVTVNGDELAHGPQLLPGGDAVLFTIAKSARDQSVRDRETQWDQAQVVVQSLPSGERKTLINGGSNGWYLSTRHLLYAVGGVIYAVAFDPRRRELLGGAVPVIEGVKRTVAGATGSVHFATSNSGSALYIPGPSGVVNQWRIASADRAGRVTPLDLPVGPYTHVRASRDGGRLAIGTDDGMEAIVWISDLAGTTARRRLTLEGHNRFPIWSPDSQRVAFQSDREGDLAVFTQRVDGTGVVERLTRPGPSEEHRPMSWSPDGKHLSFSVAKDSTWSLWTLSMESKRATPYGRVESRNPIESVFSPDGRWLAYGSTPAGRGVFNGSVYIQAFPPSSPPYQVPKLETLSSAAFHPLWAPDGSELFYVPTTASGRLVAVRVTTQPGITFGNPESLPARVTGGRRNGDPRAHDILPNGRFIGLVNAAAQDAAGSSSDASQIRVMLNWSEELKVRVPTK